MLAVSLPPRRSTAVPHRPARALRWLIAGLIAPALWSARLAPAQDTKGGRPAPARKAERPRPAGAPAAATAAAAPAVRVVVEVSPPALLKLPAYQKLAPQIPEDQKEVKALKSGAIDRISMFVLDAGQPGQPGQPPAVRPLFLVHAAQAYDWKNFITAPVVEVAGPGYKFWREGEGAGRECYRVIDGRTLLAALDEADLPLAPLATDTASTKHGWDAAWKQLPAGAVRVGVDAGWLARMVPPGQAGMGFQVIGPLLNLTDGYAFSLDAANGLTLDGRMVSPDADGAGRVGDTLRAILTLTRNMVPAIRQAAGNGPPAASQAMGHLVDSLDTMLRTARVEKDGTTTKLQLKADVGTFASAVALLLPAVQASREAARRTQSMNNLKQIGLAMFNYHEANNRFPGVKLVGADGKTPHSWRVALLPYLGQTSLFNEYNFNEPWDGPNNRKLVDRMPAVFHDPSDPDPKRPSYFALIGPDTVFPPDKAGVGIAEITDGTSNTIAIVEAQRNIPWTKPEDIPVVAGNAPLGPLGGNHPGGFNALFADGSVRFLKQTINPLVLRGLLSKAGGEIIAPDAF